MNRAKCSRAAGRTGHGENPDAQSLDCGGRKVDWAVVCTPAGRPLVPRHLHLRGRGVSETGVKRVEGARAGGWGGAGRCSGFTTTPCRAAPCPAGFLCLSETGPKSTSLMGGEGFPGQISLQPRCAAILNSCLPRPTQRSVLWNTLFGSRTSAFGFPDFIGKNSQKEKFTR